MSTNVPEWVAKTLAVAREEKIAHGKLIPGNEKAHLTQLERAFLEKQLAGEARGASAESVVFNSLDLLRRGPLY